MPMRRHSGGAGGVSPPPLKQFDDLLLRGSLGVSLRHIRVSAALRSAPSLGLEQEFNSLDNQREASEAYIKSVRQRRRHACDNTFLRLRCPLRSLVPYNKTLYIIDRGR